MFKRVCLKEQGEKGSKALVGLASIGIVKNTLKGRCLSTSTRVAPCL